MKMFDVLSSKNGKSDGLFLSVDVIYGQCAYLEEKWEKSGAPKKNFSSKTLLFPKMSDVFLKNDKQFYVCYITIR